MIHLALLFKLPFKEFRQRPWIWIQTIILFGFGVSGLISVDYLRSEIDEFTSEKAREIVGGDIVVSARRGLDVNELQDIESYLPEKKTNSQSKSFFTMVTNGKRSRLLQVVAVDMSFPLHGNINFSVDGGNTKQSLTQMNSGEIVALPEIKQMLGAHIGDSLVIGDASFILSGYIADDITATMPQASFAPRVYMRYQDIEKTQLIVKGSSYFHRSMYSFDAQPKTLKAAVESLKANIDTSDIRISSTLESEGNVMNLLKYVSDYLGLAALVTLLLVFIGGFYLFRSNLYLQMKNWSVFRSLGMPVRQLLMQDVVKGFYLSSGSGIIAFGLCKLIFLLGGASLAELLPFQLNLDLPISLLFKGIFASFICMVILNLPFFYQLMRSSLLYVLRTGENLQTGAWLNYFWGLLAIAFLWGFSVFQAHSLKVGTLFVVILLGAFAVILGCGRGLIYLSAVIAPALPINARLLLLSISRRRQLPMLNILTMSLLTFLLVLMFQVKESLENDLHFDPETTPSLFLFDIQEEQKESLVSFLKDRDVAAQNLSPMVRARLERINNKDTLTILQEKNVVNTREEEEKRRFVNRGYNLSYRNEMDASESLIKGEFPKGEFDEAQSKHPEISLERRFARRMGLKLGDLLEFDIQGVPVTGIISSIRAVKWTSFQPNFFVLFQPGVLEFAPQTHLATIGKVSEETKLMLQNDIASEFANISVIDVSRLMAKILGLVRSIGLIFTVILGLCLVSGFFLILVLAKEQATQKKKDVSLLMLMGLSQIQGRKQLLGNSLFVSFLGTLLGTILALSLAYVLYSEMFADTTLVLNPSSLALAFGTFAVFFAASGLLFTSIKIKNALSLIRNEGN